MQGILFFDKFSAETLDTMYFIIVLSFGGRGNAYYEAKKNIK